MSSTDWVNVTEFKDWWMKSGRPFLPPFYKSIHTTDIAYAVCLYRKDRFQVELYICKPNTESPPHAHPGIHSISMYLTGDLQFAKDGTFVNLSQYQHPGKFGEHMLLGKTAEVNYGTSHALRIGNVGGAFLIFEHWLDQDPVSVTVHWEGETVGEIHNQAIKNSYVESLK